MKSIVKGLDGKVSIFDTFSIIDTNRIKPQTDRLVLALFKDGSWCIEKYVGYGWEFESGEQANTPHFWMDIPRYNKLWAQERKEHTIDTIPNDDVKVLSLGAKH